MISAEDLEAAISSFIDENRAYLSTVSNTSLNQSSHVHVTTTPHTSRDGEAALASPPPAKYNVIAEMEHQATRHELLRATELLQEALREWSQEKKAHAETKTLLRLALQELQDGHGGHHRVGGGWSGAPSVLLDGNTAPVQQMRRQYPQPLQPQSTPPHESQQQSLAHIASPRWRGGGGTPKGGNRILESMLMHAAPAIVDDGGSLSPRRVTPTRSPGYLTSPHVSEGQRRFVGSHYADATTPTPHKGRAVTPPFQSGAARFRDMVPAGDQLIYETRSGNSVGLQYKKNSDITRNMKQRSGGDAPLTAYAHRARTAVEDLQRRLMSSTQQQHHPSIRDDANTNTPATPRSRTGNQSTLYSPR